MEDFVPFEIAKKLKEKGFNEPCFGWYYPYEVCGYDYQTLIVPNHSTFRGDNYKDLLISHNDDKHIDVPTIPQTLKWLRKEKNIYISIFIDDDSNYPVTYEIYKGTECVCTHQGEYFTLENWNKCELKALEYTLDNLI